MKVWALQDGQIDLELALLKGIDPVEAKRLLGGKEAAVTPVNAFLVRLPGKVVLVDTGAGETPGEETGHLTEQLAAAGVLPDDVDMILITHYHFDHVGGLLKVDGTRAFPKARLCVPRAEQTFWFQDPGTLPERLRSRVPKLKAAFAAYEIAGAFRVVEDGEDLGSGIRAVAAPGHTGGHTTFVFASAGQELWCIGDLIHFGAIQFQHPEVGVAFDLDGAKAVQARRELLRRAARSQAVLAGAHLPRLVRVKAEGAGFVATPAQQR
jgi:glyoxylase-like metal-dependent hydrolase (beta-lactamase superfamily II)